MFVYVVQISLLNYVFRKYISVLSILILQSDVILLVKNIVELTLT